MWKGTFSKTLTLSLPAKDEFFLSPLLTGDLIHLSAASLEVLSLYASVSKMSRGATTFAPPEAYTADQSTWGSNEKHYIIVKKKSIIITHRTYSKEGKK